MEAPPPLPQSPVAMPASLASASAEEKQQWKTQQAGDRSSKAAQPIVLLAEGGREWRLRAPLDFNRRADGSMRSA